MSRDYHARFIVHASVIPEVRSLLRRWNEPELQAFIGDRIVEIMTADKDQPIVVVSSMSGSAAGRFDVGTIAELPADEFGLQPGYQLLVGRRGAVIFRESEEVEETIDEAVIPGEIDVRNMNAHEIHRVRIDHGFDAPPPLAAFGDK